MIPTDDQIEEAAKKYRSNLESVEFCSSVPDVHFIDGANWMLDKLIELGLIKKDTEPELV